jgi:glycosyltransferase involved in cell wall biosynthesis
MRMSRILVVATVDVTLGQIVYPLLRSLKEAGYEVELACRITGHVAGRRLWDLMIPVHDIAFSRNPLHPTNVKALRQLRSLLRNGEFDVVDSHTPVAGWLARLGVRLFSPRTVTIYSTHGLPFARGMSPLVYAAGLYLERVAGGWTDHMTVINREDEAAALRYRLVSAQRLHYTPGRGIDTQAFDPARVSEEDICRVRQELGLAPGDVLFLMIAEVRPLKRHADVLRALARVQDDRVHVAFAGIGPLMGQVQKQVLGLGLQRRAHFLGYRQDVPALIRASRAVLSASTAEGMPGCVLESLALEVPAIGTAVRGTSEVLEGGCGILVPSGNAQALANAMRWMVAHSAECAAMGRVGRQKVQGGFDLRNVLRTQTGVFREALDQAEQAR